MSQRMLARAALSMPCWRCKLQRRPANAGVLTCNLLLYLATCITWDIRPAVIVSDMPWCGSVADNI